MKVNISEWTGFALLKSGAVKGWGWNGSEGAIGIGSTSQSQYSTPITVHT